MSAPTSNVNKEKREGGTQKASGKNIQMSEKGAP